MSRLRSRLSDLRHQAGNTHKLAPEDGPRNLRQALARSARGGTPARLTDHELADYLGGDCTAPCVITIERTLPGGRPHGRWRIGPGLAEAVAFFGHHHEVESLVFMDTETTGLAGGSGTLVFLLGLARFESGRLRLRQYFMSGFRGESALLEQATAFIRGARTLVSYNGKTFDHPLLQARYRLMGMDNPFAGLAHFDLLHPSRRAFGGCWPDCRLRTVEACLLGFQRIDDLPGAEAPDTWFQWMRQGITTHLPRVVEHNYWDLVSLAALPPALRQSYQAPVSQGADILAGARHYLQRGDEFKAHRHLLSHRSHLGADALLELARLSRRRGESELAVAIWNELAATGHVEATERLAKHHEHISRNFDLALRFCRQLMALRPDDARHSLRHRRLLDKLRRSRE